MPPPAVANGTVIQTVIETRLNQQRLLSVLHWKCVGTPSPSEYFTVMNNINNDLDKVGGWTRELAGLMTADATVWSVYSQVVYPVRGPLVEKFVNRPGTAAGVAAPQNVTLSLTKKVDAAGRGYNGRIQLMGLPMTGITDGLWNAGQIALVTAFASILLEPLDNFNDGDRFYPVTFNRKTGTTNNVRDFEVQEEVRTMHRRTVGLGI